jgi:hypothetical protein
MEKQPPAATIVQARRDFLVIISAIPTPGTEKPAGINTNPGDPQSMSLMSLGQAILTGYFPRANMSPSFSV